jgi:hypothetical protein
MNFLEVIIIFWVTVFFLVASHIILKSYKRSKEVIKISNQ